MNEFEQKLSRQPSRPVPAGWRGEILAMAPAEQASHRPAPAIHHSWISGLNSRLSKFLWPHPVAWAGLASVWIFIFALNFSMSDSSPKVIAETSSQPAPEVIAELRQQQQLYAELIGANESRDADRQKVFSPKPRSERTETEMV
jgi:hypothetical protein